MGFTNRAASAAGKQLAPRIGKVAPNLTTSFVREALSRAIAGVGPLPPAAQAADKHLAAHHGDVDKAIHEVIEANVRYAGAQGMATNLGGLATMAVAIPANITGLALIQCRMLAGIAHLRGYDLDDPRVRNALLTCLLGEDAVQGLVKKRRIPAPPMGLATAPAHDPAIDQIISAEVAAELVTRVAGKRLATTVGKRTPIIGGLVGLGADAYATWKVGRYADHELLPRPAAPGKR